tara:strand:- start:745 stop:2130 length:1386 start_codon:yes stop_codon:yes gene_type:complete
MAINRDALTTYQRTINEEIEKHRDRSKLSGFPDSGTWSWVKSAGLLNTFGGMLPRINSPLGFPGSLGLDNLNRDTLERIGIAGVKNYLMGKVFRPNQLRVVSGRLNQCLEKKGYLAFSYPNLGTDEQDLRLVLPFFENPKVSETRKAEYAKTKVMNRNEPWRLWTGASPKQLSVDITWTLPMLMEFWSANLQSQVAPLFQQEGWQQMLSRIDTILSRAKEDAKQVSEHSDNAESRIPDQKGLKYENVGGASWQIPSGKDGFSLGELDWGGLAPFGIGGGESDNTYQIAKNMVFRPSKENPQQYMAAQVISMLDVIRTSVIGNTQGARAQNTDEYLKYKDMGHVVGPPLVYAKFGSVLHTEPFIVTSYTIDFGDGKAGYENATLLPRQIKIKLKLESYNQTIAVDGQSAVASIPPPGISQILAGAGHVPLEAESSQTEYSRQVQGLNALKDVGSQLASYLPL